MNGMRLNQNLFHTCFNYQATFMNTENFYSFIINLHYFVFLRQITACIVEKIVNLTFQTFIYILQNCEKH